MNRFDAMRHSFIYPILGMLVFLGAGCMQASKSISEFPDRALQPDVAAAPDMEANVCTYNLYSGRPDDPCWRISARDTEKLISLIQEAPMTAWSPRPETDLGYKGLIVFLPSSNHLTGHSMTQVFIFQGDLSYSKDENASTDSRAYIHEPNPHFVYKADQGRNIESWLLSQGRPNLPPDLYKMIKDSWDKDVTGAGKTPDRISWKTVTSAGGGYFLRYPPTWNVSRNDKNGMLIVSNKDGKVAIGGFRPSVGHPLLDDKNLVFQKIVYTKDALDPGSIPVALYYRRGHVEMEAELMQIVKTVTPLP